MSPTELIVAIDLPRKSAPLILLLAALIVFTTACGSAAPASVPTSIPVPFTGSPLDLLKRSIEVMGTVDSFRARMEMDVNEAGKEVSLSMEMAQDAEGRIQSTVRLDLSLGEQTIEQIIAEPYIYIRLPGMGWVRTDLKAVANESGVSAELLADPKAFTSSFFPAGDIPWQLYTVESIGRESIDGVRTERLKLMVDFQQLWRHLGEETKQQFAQSIIGAGLKVEELARQIELKRMELWIDDEGYNRRTAVEMALGEGTSTNIDTRTFDINADISIELPQKFTNLR